MAVVRDDHERALVVLQRLGQRFAHFDVEVVGGLVEQQQIGLLPHEKRQRQPRFLAAGKATHRMRDHVAAEVESAEKVAQLLLARRGIDPREMPQRRFVGTQLLHLMLREVTERERLRGMPRAGERRQRSGDRFQKRRLAGAVGAEKPDAIAVEDAPVEAFEHGGRPG
jgi:hypothetical protein